MKRLFALAAAVVALAGTAGPARAVPIIFSGSDQGANSTDPRPNSNAAAAAFNAAAAALGTNNLITFESAPPRLFHQPDGCPRRHDQWGGW